MPRVLLACLFYFAASLGVAANPPVQRYYEYILYLPPGAPQDPVALAQAKLPGALHEHRLAMPTSARGWDGKGKIPLAFEARVINGREADLAEIHDTGEPLREVLGIVKPKPIRALAVLIGVPVGLNIAAYLESLRSTVEVANALNAAAFVDGETGQLYRIEGLAERMNAGQAGGTQAISATNPPAMTIMGGITRLEHQDAGGVSLLGMHKVGLPNLYLSDWIPGVTEPMLFEAISNRMLAGRIAPKAGSTFEIRVGELGGNGELELYGRPNATAALQFGLAQSAAPKFGPGTLQIEFPGPVQLDLYQRQALFINALLPSQYPNLEAGKARELLLATAGAKAQVRNLRASFPVLKKAGTRVFVTARVDRQLGGLMAKGPNAGQAEWDELIGWDGAQWRARRWRGDPRAGGAVYRMDKPITVGGHTYIYRDQDINEGEIDDILIIDSRGGAAGGDVERLIKRWAGEGAAK